MGVLKKKRMQQRLEEQAEQHIEELSALKVLNAYVAGNLPLDQMVRATLESNAATSARRAHIFSVVVTGWEAGATLGSLQKYTVETVFVP